MRNQWVATALAMSIGVAFAGCSSSPPAYPPQPGALPPGTAQLTVDDTATANTDAVESTSTSSLIMIRTGDSTGGAMAIVDNASGLDVKSVRIDTVGNQD
ncbi:MAG: lipoprotein LpqH [Mycobacterium sp.]